ncbi:Contactin, partial [Fragariocoptes setiger]
MTEPVATLNAMTTAQKPKNFSISRTFILRIPYNITLIATNLIILCSFVSAITQECPRGWIGFGQSCYRFVRWPQENIYNATLYCQSFGSRLVSVNNFEENAFLSDWLQQNDPYKRLWLTGASNEGQNVWGWAGDYSNFINTNDLWLPFDLNTIDRYQTHGGAAYAYHVPSNSWGLVRVNNKLEKFPFICEATRANLIGNRYIDKDIDYGVNVHNKSRVPRGPRIVIEPKDVIFDLSGRSQLNDLKLKCVADAYPEPEYQWYKEDNRGDRIVPLLVHVLSDDRLTLTDGTLTIFNPHQTNDRGKYHCIASNIFGRVKSQTVSLTFGYILEFGKKRSIERGRENWGKSISCDPPQHQPRVNYYWTRAEFPNFIQQDRRVFISHDGNLYFSSLEKIDRANYSCNIQSVISSTGRFGPSFPLVIEPASNGQKLQFANGFPKSFPEGALAGQDVRLECMAYGYPTPSYNWTRSGATNRMPQGYSIINDGKVLLLPKVRIEDAGEYTCRVMSESDSLQKSVIITVQAAPTFTMPITHQILGENEPMVWKCEAHGIPDVKYTWLKDGNEINVASLPPEDSTRYRIENNIFTIDGVKEARDQGMYQCQASNQHGSAYSSAQLKIMRLAPTFEKYPMPKETVAMVGQNLTIPCPVEAVPRANIRWRKDGRPYDQNTDLMRFSTPLRGAVSSVNSNLIHIQRIRSSDEGRYECIAENVHGNAISSTWLHVKQAPRFIDYPKRVELARYGDFIRWLNCEVQPDYNLEIANEWLKNGLKLKLDPDGKYSLGDRGQLIIRNITFSDHANYTCQAKTSIGSVEQSGSLYVEGPPDACGAVIADDLKQDSAKVSWTDGSEHGKRIWGNTIEGRTNHNQTWVVLAANVSALDRARPLQPGDIQFLRKTFQLTGLLLPWSEYEFRVSATNDYGHGPPSAPSPMYRTEMAPPRHPVSNVRGGGGKAGTLVIQWDPLPQMLWAANEIWYQVYYKLNDTGADWNKRELRSAGNTGAYTINVGSDNYYRLFNVMVQPINPMGAGPLGQMADIYSAQRMPQIQPANVYAVAYNSTALNVTWTPINIKAEERGKLVGYRIKYWPSNKDPQTHSLTALKRGLDGWGVIVGLQPDTEYRLVVMAYNDAGSGPESEQFLIKTFKAAPQRPPTSVQLKAVDSTSVQVSWRGVSGTTTNEEPILGYKVRYWRIDQPISEAIDVYKNLDGQERELSLIIRDLVPGETYKIRVLAYSSGGDGKMSSPEKIVTV